MSFLGKPKTVGKYLLNVIAIAKPVAQTAGQVVPGPDVFEAIYALIVNIEVFAEIFKKQGTRIDKFNLALPVVKDLIRNSEQFKLYNIPEDVLTESARAYVNTTVKLLNAIKPKAVSAEN
jgi:hypothetical protein